MRTVEPPNNTIEPKPILLSSSSKGRKLPICFFDHQQNKFQFLPKVEQSFSPPANRIRSNYGYRGTPYGYPQIRRMKNCHRIWPIA